MTINNHEFSGKEILGIGSLEAPFGKRLYDQAMVKKIRGVAKFKFWGTLSTMWAITVLLEAAKSDRVWRFSAKPMKYASESMQVERGRVIVPELVMKYHHEARVSPIWTKVKISPIQVLSFTNAKEIPPGAEGKAVLLTGATNGLIKAKLTESVKVDGVALLDAGVLLIGQGHSTEERLYITFKKAVFRDGKSVNISAQAYDITDAILGLKGSRVGDLTLKLAASGGLNFLSGMAVGMTDSPTDSMGKPLRPSVNDAALNGLSKAAGEQAKAYMEDIKNRPPIIEVKSGTLFTITFDGGNE